jgi:hypothetical protein
MGILDPKPLTLAAANAAFIPKASSQIGLDADGVPYFSDTLAFTDAVPVLTDTDGVPYINA